MKEYRYLYHDVIIPAGANIYVGDDMLTLSKGISKTKLEETLHDVFGKDIEFIKAKGDNHNFVSVVYYARIEKKKPYVFGDKVSHDNRRAVFLKYVITPINEPKQAWIIYEGGIRAMRADANEIILI